MSEECIFCKIAKDEVNAEKIYENKEFFSVPDAAPQIEGHSLVISKKHFKDASELPKELGEDLLDCIQKTAKKLLDRFGADGFNIINNASKAAGQIVDHVHFHILPRKEGDGYFISLKKKE